MKNRKQIRQIVESTLKEVINENMDRFSSDMENLYRYVSKNGFTDLKDTILTDIVEMSDLNNLDEDKYIYDENAMYYLLRDLVNYDWVAINEEEVDVNNSNHKYVAKIIKRYVSPPMCKRVYSSFFLTLFKECFKVS